MRRAYINREATTFERDERERAKEVWKYCQPSSLALFRKLLRNYNLLIESLAKFYPVGCVKLIFFISEFSKMIKDLHRGTRF